MRSGIPIAVLALIAGCGDATTVNDLAGSHAVDLSSETSRDLSFAITDLSTMAFATTDLSAMDFATIPLLDGGSNGVGPHGGSVDRLYFAFHGDTRGPNCDDPSNYPTTIIQGIYQKEAALGVQFAVDLGDHMNACGTVSGEAQMEMGFYANASALLGKLTFMTMGNHECSIKGFCDASDPNLAAFLQVLSPISTTPYYTFDVSTQTGIATFVIIADNVWDTTEQQWLDATLTKADTTAKYTIITRHHPIDYLKLSAPDEWSIIQKHKYSLFLVSHSHQYLRDMANDPSGRTVVMGAGGAPLAAGQTYYGFATVKQETDDRLTVAAYDQATGMPQDSWSITPQ